MDGVGLGRAQRSGKRRRTTARRGLQAASGPRGRNRAATSGARRVRLQGHVQPSPASARPPPFLMPSFELNCACTLDALSVVGRTPGEAHCQRARALRTPSPPLAPPHCSSTLSNTPEADPARQSESVSQDLQHELGPSDNSTRSVAPHRAPAGATQNGPEFGGRAGDIWLSSLSGRLALVHALDEHPRALAQALLLGPRRPAAPRPPTTPWQHQPRRHDPDPNEGLTESSTAHRRETRTRRACCPCPSARAGTRGSGARAGSSAAAPLEFFCAAT